jgi:hypothetical protein
MPCAWGAKLTIGYARFFPFAEKEAIAVEFFYTGPILGDVDHIVAVHRQPLWVRERLAILTTREPLANKDAVIGKLLHLKARRFQHINLAAAIHPNISDAHKFARIRPLPAPPG